MALRPVTHSHPCRNYPPVMVMDFLRILPGSAKDLNSHRESALAIPRRPAARLVIAVAAAALVAAAAALLLSFDPSCSADFSAALAVVAPDVSSVSRSF